VTYFQWNHLLLNNTSSFITIRKYVFVYLYVSVQIYVTFSCFATVVMLFCALLYVRLLRANKDTYIHTTGLQLLFKPRSSAAELFVNIIGSMCTLLVHEIFKQACFRKRLLPAYSEFQKQLQKHCLSAANASVHRLDDR